MAALLVVYQYKDRHASEECSIILGLYDIPCMGQ